MNERDMNLLDWRDNLITWLHVTSLVYWDKITMKRGFSPIWINTWNLIWTVDLKFSFTENLETIIITLKAWNDDW